MRNHFVCALLLSMASSLTAQNLPSSSPYEQKVNQRIAAHPYPAQLMQELAQLRDAALTDDYAYQQVAHISDNIGPRPEGSAQAAAAVTYVVDELRRLGLEVHLEPVMVQRWVRSEETAELVQYPGQAPGTTQKIVLTALSGNHPTMGDGLTADVVAVNTFDELKALGQEKVRGKIVLFNEPFDHRKAESGLALAAYEEAVVYRSLAAKRAQALGAVAALVRSVGNADYRLPHTGWSAPANIPAGAVTSEDADLIARLASEGTVRMHLVLKSYTGAPVQSFNVIGDIKGSEQPQQVVIVSGHLDSWDLGTGAIDDAAGVAVAMETAQLIQKLHLHPKRTLRVIAWMDEENNGTGHTTYAREHAGETGNYAGAIESDLGAGHPLGFWAQINPQALPLLQPVQSILQPVGANVIQISDDTGSDIDPLGKVGVPCFGVMQDARRYFNYHHTAADTLDKIIPSELRENAAAMAVLGYALTNMPETLPR